jgi:SAM-dependent methyltransferase
VSNLLHLAPRCPRRHHAGPQGTLPLDDPREGVFVTVPNADMAAAWDGPEGAHWAEYADHYERVAANLWESFLATVPVGEGDSVLDIGCGTGRSTRTVAQLAPRGSVLGVDLSRQMLERARATAADDGLDNVAFEQADVQVFEFDPDSFDLAISSFGAMFFDDPVAAFSNVRGALRPGGQLVLLAWQPLAANEWLVAIRTALAVGRLLPEPPTGLPGPFGLADPDHSRAVLEKAGFADVQVAPLQASMSFGDDVESSYAFLSSGGVARGLTQDLDAATRQLALDALRATLTAHDTGDGIRFGAAAWRISARRGE